MNLRSRNLQSAGGYSSGGGSGSGGAELIGEVLYIAVEITYHAAFYPEFWILIVAIIMLTFAGILLYTMFVDCYQQCFLRYTSTSKKRWLKNANKDKKIKLVNSTTWKGNYTQDGEGFFIPDFEMTIDKSLTISGKGKDNVGNYLLVGKQLGDRVALTKTYIPDHNGYHNRGHKVKILMTITDQNRMEGRWSINSERYREGHMTFCSI
jgi:hypothetical protein